MITLTFTGDSKAEVLEQLADFLETQAPGKKAPLKKVADDEPEDKPTKKTPAKKVDVSDEALRTALVNTGWEKPHLVAFTKKFAADNGSDAENIPNLPNNIREEYLEELEKVSAFNEKKRTTYLGDYLDTEL